MEQPAGLVWYPGWQATGFEQVLPDGLNPAGHETVPVEAPGFVPFVGFVGVPTLTPVSKVMPVHLPTPKTFAKSAVGLTLVLSIPTI